MPTENLLPVPEYEGLYSMTEGNRCEAVGPMGYRCTRQVDHKGDHCADEPAINVCWDRWRNNNQGANK